MMTVAEVVALIASRMHRNGERERPARDRARKWLIYQVEKGHLRAYAGKVASDDLGAFLHPRYPGQFNDLPPFNAGAGAAVGVSEVAGITDFCDALVLPGDLPRCHDEIKRLTDEVSALRRDLNAAQLRTVELEPDAKRWRRHKEKLRVNARRPRKV